jgi:hypothetical protein
MRKENKMMGEDEQLNDFQGHQALNFSVDHKFARKINLWRSPPGLP